MRCSNTNSATMVGNPPTPQEARHSKITLLVVPGAVIRQWQNEIVKHVKSGVFKKIMHYKAKKDISMEILQDCDILSKQGKVEARLVSNTWAVTSYSEVMNSCKSTIAEFCVWSLTVS